MRAMLCTQLRYRLEVQRFTIDKRPIHIPQDAGERAVNQMFARAHKRIYRVYEIENTATIAQTSAKSRIPPPVAGVIFGLLAPAGTPAVIVRRLSGAVNDGLRSAEVRASWHASGLEARIGTPEEFGEAPGEQARQWKGVTEEIGVKLE